MRDPTHDIVRDKCDPTCGGCGPPVPQYRLVSRLRLGGISLLFVSVAALLLLVSLADERLHVLDWALHKLPGWLALALVTLGGYPIFVGLTRDLRRGRITAHAVMALGLVAALFAKEYATAVVIVFFMRVGEYIESFTVNRSRAAIQALTEEVPQKATVRRNGREEVIPVAEVQAGDIVIVRPGQRVPADGVVVLGGAEIDQAVITGESMPVAKGRGHQVYAATVNQVGYIEVRAEHVGSDSMFGRILHLVEEAQAARAPVQRLADRFSAYFIPLVLVAAALAFMTTGKPMNAVAVLVVACSCAIAIATPMAVAAAVGAGARRGILVKGGAYLEALAQVDTLVVDKTGTLTFGAPTVTDTIQINGWTPQEIRRVAAGVERYSEHPLARAVVAAAMRDGNGLATGTDFQISAGRGVAASVDNHSVSVGTAEWTAASDSALALASQLREQGKTAIFVSVDGSSVGVFGVADEVRPDLPQAFGQLRQMGIQRIIMATGDSETVAAILARQLGIEYAAELLPADKTALVQKLQANGRRVAMVGDGINDAPALAVSDVGIAMAAAGTAAAIEASDIALMTDDWNQIPATIRLARRAFSVIGQNLFLTGAYNLVGITLAWTGILPPIAAAAAQSLPDVGILLNSSRLLRSPR